MSKGKFENDVAEYLYGLSLDGVGEEVGDVQYGGWHCLFDFDEATAIAVNNLLPEDERTGRCCWFHDDGKITTGFWGAILHEDSQGFVDVELCETSMEADEAWNSIQHEQEIFA